MSYEESGMLAALRSDPLVPAAPPAVAAVPLATLVRPGSCKRRALASRLGLLIAVSIVLSACGSVSSASQETQGTPLVSRGVRATPLEETQAAPSVSEETPTTQSVSEESQPAQSVSEETQATPATVCAPVSADVESVRVPVAWSEGRMVQLEVEIRKDRPGSAIPAGASSLTPVSVVVVAEDSDGWLLEWRQSGTVLESFGLPPELASTTGGVGMPAIEYRLSRQGVVGGVQNVGELRVALLSTLGLLAERAGGADSTIAGLVSLYENLPDESLANLLTQTLVTFHAFDGIEVDVGSGVTFDGELPNWLGGPPFPAVTTLSVEEVVDQGGCVLLQIRTVPDSELFASAMAESLKGALEASDENAQEVEAALEGFDIETTVIARIDATTGRAVEVTAETRVTDGTVTAVNSTVIRDVTSG